MDETPTDPFDTDLDLEEVTPLRGQVMEAHEIFEELRYSGFSEGQALKIVGHILYDMTSSRFYDDEDEDDEDDSSEDGFVSE